MIVGRFEEEWESLTRKYEHGSFRYEDSSFSARKIIISEFRNVQRQSKYGVYVIRQEATREVLYIGKGGTIDQAGRFKNQDIPNRLANVKGSNLPADIWFSGLVKEKGPLVIEYVFLASTPESPGLIESFLLQAYLNKLGCLPYRNNAL
ncbi:MAG: hypothetical protein HY695_00855 [Deltaproteobacteria bacterium]|nr:hypothetical protein [Deltaproteobacteria bacterium]